MTKSLLGSSVFSALLCVGCLSESEKPNWVDAQVTDVQVVDVQVADVQVRTDTRFMDARILDGQVILDASIPLDISIAIDANSPLDGSLDLPAIDSGMDAALDGAAGPVLPQELRALQPHRWTPISRNLFTSVNPCSPENVESCGYSGVSGQGGVLYDYNGGNFASAEGALGSLALWGGA